MASYDPSTAHRHEWRFRQFAKPATYEFPPGEGDGLSDYQIVAELDDINHPDYAGIAGRLVTRDTASAALVWNPQEDHEFEPRIDGLIRFEDKTGWVIRSVQARRYGHWAVALEPERVDSD